MGLYLGSSAGRMLPAWVEGTITPGEYRRAMAHVLQTLREPPELSRRCYQRALSCLQTERFAAAAVCLADLVRREPRNHIAHRLLGIVLLARRHLSGATDHLEITYRLLKRQASVEKTLEGCLRVQCEAALVRYLLIPLYTETGRRRKALAIVAEDQGGAGGRGAGE